MKIIFFLVAFLLISFHSNATDSIKLEIKADSVATVGQQFSVQYVVNAECEKLQLSNAIIEGFKILFGPSTSKNISTTTIKGVQEVRHTTTFNYVLIPTKKGFFRLPEASVEIDGKIYTCDGQKIKVLPPKRLANSPFYKQGEGVLSKLTDKFLLFVKQEISKKTIFEREPVKVSYKFYSKLDITDVPEIKLPAFDGFWIEEMNADSTISFVAEDYNNSIYTTLVIKEYTLYPLRPGELIIDGFLLDIGFKKETDKKVQTFFGEQTIYEECRDTLYVDADTIQVIASSNNVSKEFEQSLTLSSESSKKALKKNLKGKSDMVLAMDISSSMLAKDFEPNRSEVTKGVIKTFKSKLSKQQIGFVLFAGKNYPQTTNINTLPSDLDYKELVPEKIFEDGTAIGMGIVSSLNRLDLSSSTPKSIVLITDGSNNTGTLSPLTAADIARQKGVSIFIIGIGGFGKAPFPNISSSGEIEYIDMEVKIDEETLKEITSMTGGKYFRATDNKSLDDATNEVIKLLQELKYSDPKEAKYIHPENVQYILNAIR